MLINWRHIANKKREREREQKTKHDVCLETFLQFPAAFFFINAKFQCHLDAIFSQLTKLNIT